MAKKSLLSGKLQREKTPTELSPEQVEQAFQQITSVKTNPTPAAAVIQRAEPPVVSQNTPNRAVELEKEEAKTRLSIDIPKDLHRKIKRKIVDTDQTIMQYVVALIERDLA
jgi:hypothetical protein